MGFCFWGADKRINVLLSETNRLLGRYKFQRSLPAFLPREKSGRPDIVALTKSIGRERKYGKQIPISETAAVDLVLWMAEWNGANLLRRCPVCQKWFVATRKDQKRCGLSCNKKAYRQKHRKTSAAYMRIYRRKIREREIRKRDKWKIWKEGKRYAKR
jgi:hypothetical protein